MDLGDWIDEEEFQPRFNIAPRTRSPVIRRDIRNATPGPAPRDAGNNEESAQSSSPDNSNSMPKYVMQTMKWGLVPSWSKHEDKTMSTTNARAENLVEGGGMWNSMRGKKRCAVLCQG